MNQQISLFDFLPEQIVEPTPLSHTDNTGEENNTHSISDTTQLDRLRSFLEEVALMTDVYEQTAGEEDALKLMSVHASKGLEFPLVFLVGLEEDLFPLSKARLDPDDLEEERRLMYVAITRAKDHLFLSYAHSRQQRGQMKYNQPSRFLDEIPEDLKKVYDLTGGSGSVSAKKKKAPFREGDRVLHKLFGKGEVLEVWNHLVIVKFENSKFGLRKVEYQFLQECE